jgi:hypothetical protein
MLKAATCQRPQKMATTGGKKEAKKPTKAKTNNKLETKATSAEGKAKAAEAKSAPRGENKAAEPQPGAVIPMPDTGQLPTLARSA